MQSTAELVSAAQAGDRSAFAVLVANYERAATASAWAIVGDFHVAQEIAQDGFVSAFRALGTLRQAEGFGPWLLKIVRRAAMRRTTQMKSKAMVPIDAVLHDRAAPREDEPDGKNALLLQAFAQLPEHERIVVSFRYLNSLSVAEIAAATGSPVGTVTKQLSRALQRLREILTEDLL